MQNQILYDQFEAIVGRQDITTFERLTEVAERIEVYLRNIKAQGLSVPERTELQAEVFEHAGWKITGTLAAKALAIDGTDSHSRIMRLLGSSANQIRQSLALTVRITD